MGNGELQLELEILQNGMQVPPLNSALILPTALSLSPVCLEVGRRFTASSTSSNQR